MSGTNYDKLFSKRTIKMVKVGIVIDVLWQGALLFVCINFVYTHKSDSMVFYDNTYYIAIIGNCIWLYSDYFTYKNHLKDEESTSFSKKMNKAKASHSLVKRYEELKNEFLDDSFESDNLEYDPDANEQFETPIAADDKTEELREEKKVEYVSQSSNATSRMDDS
jgi:hypothetical protein